MSDTAAPSGPSTSSVVLDTNATVKSSRIAVIMATVAVFAFVAFSVVWFATRDGYEPGPAASALLDSLERQEVDVELSDAELECVDEVMEGVDPSVFSDNPVDPLSVDPNDPEAAAQAGRMFDECFVQQTRIAVFAAGMTSDGTTTPEQADCAAKVFDDAIMGAGGYGEFLSGSEEMMGMMFGLFGALEECGIDIFGAMDATSGDDA